MIITTGSATGSAGHLNPSINKIEVVFFSLVLPLVKCTQCYCPKSKVVKNSDVVTKALSIERSISL